VTRALAVALTASLLAAAAAGAGDAGTITMGRGIGPWQIGRPYLKADRLVHSERFPENAGPGCIVGVRSATRIDVYRTIRAAWRQGVRGRLYLFDIATTSAGNRSGDGFVIAKSRLVAVRRAHPKATFGYGRGELALGASYVKSVRRIATERYTSYTYWFDARGVLTALETGITGC
jgi:hypothetical protein